MGGLSMLDKIITVVLLIVFLPLLLWALLNEIVW